jgi:hypothetical protein
VCVKQALLEDVGCLTRNEEKIKHAMAEAQVSSKLGTEQ